MSTTTNPSFPTSITQDGSGVPWTDPSVLVSAGVGAEAILYTANSNHFTQTLNGTGIIWRDAFNNPVTIPNDAIILGITMTVNSETSGGSVHDSAAYGKYNLLGVPSIEKGDAFPATPWLEGTVLNIIRGGPGDTWGCPSITPAQLNDPAFGWSFSVNGTQLPGRGVDFTTFYVTLQVTYTTVAVPPAGPGFGAGYDFAGINNVWGAGGIGPAAPLSLVATSGANQVALSWSASAGASYYNLFRGTSPGGESGTPVATNILVTSYTDAGLTNGVDYYYYVKAVNFFGVSAASNEANAIPDAPVSLVQVASSNFPTQASAVTLVSNPTAGNTLVFCVTTNIVTVTPPAGLILQASNSSSGMNSYVWTRVVQAGDGKVWTFTTSSDYFETGTFTVAEIIGTLSNFACGLGTSSTSPSQIVSPSISPASNSVVIAAVTCLDGGSDTFSGVSPNPPYTKNSSFGQGTVSSGVFVTGSGSPLPAGPITALNDNGSNMWAIAY